MAKSPAYQWYPKDILASARVQEMSLAEEGAYRRLLDYCWLNGNVPADVKRCARLIGKGATEEIAKVVLEMFIPDPNRPDRMIHDRLEIERENQKKNSEARRSAAEARWGKQGTSGDATGKQVKPLLDEDEMQTLSESNANAFQTECPATASSSATAKENTAAAAPANLPPDHFPDQQNCETTESEINGIAACLSGFYAVGDRTGWGLNGKLQSLAIELHGARADIQSLTSFWNYRTKKPAIQYFGQDYIAWRATQNGAAKAIPAEDFQSRVEAVRKSLQETEKRRERLGIT